MVSTILGKRARAPDSFNEHLSSSSPRAKRRTQAPIINDENADPEDAYVTQPPTHHNDSLGLGSPENPFHKFASSARVASAPAKPTVKTERVSISPTKSFEQFEATKVALNENVNAVQIPTPQTPRHRDALSKKVPITPRHRIGLVGRPLTPRSLRTPKTPTDAPTVYNDARQMFARSADPGCLITRESERNELNSFIEGGIETRTGRCLYVSGPPGTGKSALTSEVCRKFRVAEGVKTSYINCMSVKSSQDIYDKLVKDLIGDIEYAGRDDLKELHKVFMPKKKLNRSIYIVTLDEIDHLLTLDLEILYTLFEWSLQRSSSLVLIGIANALDLTDRFLPRLKARNMKPQHLAFLPYTAPQITSVITTKLHSLYSAATPLEKGFVPIIQPAAIQFCSKKVAAQTGDLRKAFDIIRRTIDLIETEVKQKRLSGPISPFTMKSPLQENYNLSSYSVQSIDSSSVLTPASAPRATIAHVARVSASILGNGTSQRLQTLNLQQKAALCTLISIEKSSCRLQPPRSTFPTPSRTPSKSSSPWAAPTVRMLYEAYCSLCSRENALHPLMATEFADVISGLETLGLVGEDGRILALGLRTPGKKVRRVSPSEEKRLVSWVREGEVEGCLAGPGGGILRGLLRGE